MTLDEEIKKIRERENKRLEAMKLSRKYEIKATKAKNSKEKQECDKIARQYLLVAKKLRD